ncbi:hypothetical protein AVEN_160201-1 [Araneus ventricosus]|uniref:Uncharacterized protein n=1 Tax=Araneus ventricosus TaxID=182803 RepID=A0A4Y2TR92_ARAVE|nr:hypothetical protein AVEN_160201-1 [Araneus ventricosus]
MRETKKKQKNKEIADSQVLWHNMWRKPKKSKKNSRNGRLRSSRRTSCIICNLPIFSRTTESKKLAVEPKDEISSLS